MKRTTPGVLFAFLTRSAFACASLALATTCLAQGRIWIVDAAMGPGAHFADISAACANASPGDRILVRRGTYPQFNLTKGVTILGESGAKLSGSSGYSWVTDVPAGQTLAIQNLEVPAVNVLDCKGRVMLDHVKGWLIRAVGSSQVHVSESQSGVLVASNSQVSVTNSQIDARPNGQSFAAVIAKGARVTMAGCQVTGGQFYGIAWPAIGLDSTSVLTLTGDSSSFVRFSTRYPPHPQGWTIDISGSGTLTLDPRVQGAPNKSPTIAGAIQVTRRTVPFLDARGAPLGGTVKVTLKAGVNHPFFLAVGLPGTVTFYPSLGGSVWLDLSNAVLIGTGRLDAAGVYQWSVPVPQDGVLLGLALVWQGSAGPSLNQQSLSNPAAYVHGF